MTNIELIKNELKKISRTVEGLKAMLEQVEVPAPTKQKTKKQIEREQRKAKIHAKF